MLVIYDLDKTCLYCPIADYMDRFIPNNLFLKQLYYKLYPLVHIVEMKLGLLQINHEMYLRALRFKNQVRNCRQVIITARHRSLSTELHKQAVFRHLDIPVICIAQGITNISKAGAASLLPVDKDEEVIMYDDNIDEINKMNCLFKPRFTGINILFKDNKERFLTIVN